MPLAATARIGFASGPYWGNLSPDLLALVSGHHSSLCANVHLLILVKMA